MKEHFFSIKNTMQFAHKTVSKVKKVHKYYAAKLTPPVSEAHQAISFVYALQNYQQHENYWLQRWCTNIY